MAGDDPYLCSSNSALLRASTDSVADGMGNLGGGDAVGGMSLPGGVQGMEYVTEMKALSGP